MAFDPLKRQKFISSTIALIKKHNFDGLDLDWEYPGWLRQQKRTLCSDSDNSPDWIFFTLLGGRSDSPGSSEDYKNYITLLKEIRTAFDETEGQRLLLTAAVSAGQSTIDKGYDVAAMAPLMDLINVMTYDYHGWWPGHRLDF